MELELGDEGLLLRREEQVMLSVGVDEVLDGREEDPLEVPNSKQRNS